MYRTQADAQRYNLYYFNFFLTVNKSHKKTTTNNVLNPLSILYDIPTLFVAHIPKPIDF